MKKYAYEHSRLKYQLLDKQRRGVREVIWKLEPAQVEFIEQKFGFEVIPYLYEIKTRSFYNVKNVDNLLKDIHYLHKKGKKIMVFKLNSKQRKLLDQFEVKYRPYKYRIIIMQ